MRRLYRIVLADDHVIFRRGMKRLIDEGPGLKVVGEAGDGFELINCLKRCRADMAIVDISMPGIGGVALTRDLRRQFPDIKVLILTMHKNTEYLYTAFASGAHGYLLKEDSDIELFRAIAAIRGDRHYVTGKLADELMDDISNIARGDGTLPLNPLSHRERQILELIAEGRLNREIAELLHISVRTVENHRARLMKKLNLSKTAELIRYAVQTRLAQ
jgi:DNA-binding NarL/FixJ family response regulator